MAKKPVRTKRQLTTDELAIRKRWAIRNGLNWVGFFLIGLLNNMSYVVVNSFSKKLMGHFGKEELTSVCVWLNTGLGIFVRILHSFLYKVPFMVRIISALVAYLAGLLIVAFSTSIHISMCFVGIILVGTSSNFGESAIMAYMRKFPPESVGGFSSGTGCAGIAGAGLVLLFRAVDLKPMIAFLVLTPATLAYFLIYCFWVREPKGYPPNPPLYEDEVVANEDESALLGTKSEDDAGLNGIHKASQNLIVNRTEDDTIANTETSPLLPVENEYQPKETTIKRYCRIHGAVFSWSLQLGLVYLFEYVITTAGSIIACPKSRCENDPRFYVKNSFEIVSMAYQIGVFISRSSLSCVKIRRVWIMTLLQFLNLVLWIFQDAFQFVRGGFMWFLYAHTIFVGLMGGGMYVNVFYLILNDKEKGLTNEDRELATNITMIYINLGITSAALINILMQNVIFKHIK
ncbi:putative Cln3 protein [Blattamonas nauphoetae]|uniref:Cln3 protein n=1 Tax=Blattamonas nauphoetae TaxID=2049346 RepID=A0ABQ9X3E7_9EUKA|nr:putative Cln3 protein [Blattamonas nauphoetae]